jgi:hypothetical protein
MYICITVHRDTCHCRGAHDDNTVTGKHADVDMYVIHIYISMFTSHGIIIMCPSTVTHIPIDCNTYLHVHDDNTVTGKHADVDIYYVLYGYVSL